MLALSGPPIVAAGPAAAESPRSAEAPVLPDYGAVRAYDGPSTSAIWVLGAARSGDGGGGLFVQAEGGDDDGVTVLVDRSGRRYRRQYTGAVDVRWAGAKCDGVSDDADAVMAAARVGPIAFAAGVCFLGRSVAVGAPVFAHGGMIRVGVGVVVRFDAGFEAGPRQVFVDAARGAGAVRFNPRTQSFGYPEWWGARTGQPDFDCEPALAACVEACAVTRLQPGDYWIHTTWKIQLNGRIVEGVNGDGDGTEPITRVMMNSPSLDMVLLGRDKQPAARSTRDFAGFIHLRHLTFSRTTAPDAPAGPPPAGPSGVRLQWLTSSSLEDVWSNDSTNAFHIRGAVFCKLRECHAFRSRASVRPGNDHYVGFLQDNSVDIGMNSGNASLYYELCGATGAFQGMSASYGIYTVGGFTDTFVDKFETSGIQHGLVFNGAASSGDYPSENLTVTSCVIDTPIVGLQISAPGSRRTAASVIGCYFGIGLANGRTAIMIDHCTGAVTLTGNQVISGKLAPDAVGLLVTGSSGVNASGNVYTDVANPIVLQGASNCRLADTVSVSQDLQGAAAIALRDVSRSVVDCMVRGALAAYQAGVSLDESAFNEVRCSGVDPAAVRGGASRKLVADGIPVRSGGGFGRGNLAVGILD